MTSPSETEKMYDCFKQGGELGCALEEVRLELENIASGREHEAEIIREHLTKIGNLVQKQDCLDGKKGEKLLYGLETIISEANGNKWQSALVKFNKFSDVMLTNSRPL